MNNKICIKHKYKKYKVPKIKIDIEKYNHVLSTISIQLDQKLNDYFYQNENWYDNEYNTLIGNLEKVIDSKTKKETAKLIHYFHKQSKDLSNNIKGYDILYESDNEYKVKIDIVSLRKAILNQCSSFMNDFYDADISIKINIDDDIKISVDKTLFSIIMYNFFDNVKKYTKQSSEIRFNFDKAENILDICMFSVKMEKNELNNLFNEGIRGEHANDVSSSGNGIGLSVIKKCLKLMGMRNMYISPEYNVTEEYDGIKFYKNHFIFDFNIKV